MVLQCCTETRAREESASFLESVAPLFFEKKYRRRGRAPFVIISRYSIIFRRNFRIIRDCFRILPK